MGGGLVAAGLLLNRPLLETLAPDGTIESGVLRGLIVAGQLALVTTGIVVSARWETRIAAVLGPRGMSALTAVGSLLLGLLLAEGLVRLAMGPVDGWAPPAPIYVGERTDRPSRNFVSDSLIGWRMRPGGSFDWTIDGRELTYRANEAGFRSPYDPEGVRRGEGRVVVVGDSFAFGTGVIADSTFAAVLDRALGDGTTVHNLALPGMGIDQMWMTLRHRALPLDPHVVIVAFIDQDFDRSLTAFRSTEGRNKPTFVTTDGGLRRATAADRPVAPLVWLQRNSAIAALLRAAARGVGRLRGVGRWWTVNATLLDAMVADARSAGAALVLVRLPIRGARPFPALGSRYADSEAVLLDLALPERRGLHFATDDHINEAGHRLVADTLVGVVRPLLPR